MDLLAHIIFDWAIKEAKHLHCKSSAAKSEGFTFSDEMRCLSVVPEVFFPSEIFSQKYNAHKNHMV